MEFVEDYRRGGARQNRTHLALMARGIDSATARSLVSKGLTLTELKRRTENELLALGISKPVANDILGETRTPIPSKNVTRVLSASRMTCCVCRSGEAGVIIHHINPWAVSRNHNCSNLAVLCLDHHDKAHKSGGLTQNLTPARVAAMKAAWEKEVMTYDGRTILKASVSNDDCWWFFNHKRLFGLASYMSVDLRQMRTYKAALATGVIDSAGYLHERDHDRTYLYAGTAGMKLYAYIKELLDAVLCRLAVVNVSDILDRGAMKAMLSIGDFIFLQGAVDFASTAKLRAGSGQTVRCSRTANGVSVLFTIDRWEATSNSAWSVWLTGHRSSGCLLRVLDFAQSSRGKLQIEASALAIGAALPGLKTREYSNLPYRPGYLVASDENEALDEVPVDSDDQTDANGEFGLS